MEPGFIQRVRALCVAACILGTLLPASATNQPVTAKSGLKLTHLPVGMRVVFDSPDRILVSGDNTACGWKSDPMSGSAETTISADAKDRDALNERLRRMIGIDTAALSRLDIVRSGPSVSMVVEMAADAITANGTYLRRVVTVVKPFPAKGVVITGYCIAPGKDFDNARGSLIEAAGSALPGDAVATKKPG